ncbi:MAG: hypothetical protein B9S32_15270 [Verrucomicrobia bacterium Tous-C9LFEB]|nr:MAG: hypothetical protein B9S32_15270 [Verrucomicrobia bacterium Tous-C9LFEB]
MNTTIKRWGPVLLYALIITTISSIPSQQLPPGGFENSDKIAHLVLYSGAGFVARRAVASSPVAIVMVSAYGAFDELYQNLIPGRNCSASDWIADTVGGIVGALLYIWYEKSRRRPTP